MQPIHQMVQVSYHYAVHFTQQLFACDNPLLRDVISGGDMQPPKKILCIVDRGVWQHHPDLLDAISSYCQYHRLLMWLVCPPLVVLGGLCGSDSTPWCSSHSRAHDRAFSERFRDRRQE